MVLARLRSPRDLSTLAVRVLGAIGYILAGLVTVNPPVSDKSHGIDLLWVVGLGSALIIATVFEWLTHKEDDVGKTVREAMAEKNREHAYVLVEKMKYKISEYAHFSQVEWERKSKDIQLSDPRLAPMVKTQNKKMHDEFNRHVWSELRQVLGELKQFQFVSIDEELMRIVSEGFSKDGDVSTAFMELDSIALSLLYPVPHE